MSGEEAEKRWEIPGRLERVEERERAGVGRVGEGELDIYIYANTKKMARWGSRGRRRGERQPPGGMH